MDRTIHDRLSGRRITVMGLGRFGGGLGVTLYLASHGAHVLVTDTEPASRLNDPLAALEPLVRDGAVTLRLGGHCEADFRQADLVVANPAVPRPWQNPYLRAAVEAGVPVTTEIGLLCGRIRDWSRVLGVTGSAGKSTTTSMIGAALTALGERVLIGGNLGGSLLSLADGLDAPAPPWLVLELSSAMLHWLGPIGPHAAVVTNFSPNHLDWHAELDHYRACKQNLLAGMAPGASAVLGASVQNWTIPGGVARVAVGPPNAEGLPALRVPGAHNRLNAAMAIAAVRAALPEAPAAAVAPALAAFGGLAHRLEHVTDHNGVRCYNDSKSTTPESCLLAIDAFAPDQSRVHLIAGGYDKGSDLSPVARLADRVAGVYAIGATGPALAATAARVTLCGTLERAVEAAFARACPGDVLLLSPACASWDQFENFEKRGEAFRKLVATHETAHA